MSSDSSTQSKDASTSTGKPSGSFFKSYLFKSFILPKMAHYLMLMGWFFTGFGFAGFLSDEAPNQSEQIFMIVGPAMIIFFGAFWLGARARRTPIVYGVRE